MPIVNSFSNGSARAYGFTSGGPSLVVLSANPGPSATVSTYSGYIVFTFTSSGTLEVGSGAPGTADVFVVGGGASGTRAPTGGAGGAGGAGGLRNATPGTTITAGSPIPITIGAGGSHGPGTGPTTGSPSSFGPLSSSPGTSGGSGGAGGPYVAPSANPQIPGTNGSPGPTNDYATGSSQNYGGGGGGGSAFNGDRGYGAQSSGGSSGGGVGGKGGYINTSPGNFGTWSGVPATSGGAGGANTGGAGGGGGGGWPSPGYPNLYVAPGSGGNGGSGVVVIRFPDTQFKTV